MKKKILLISLELNFTPNTLGCEGLMSDVHSNTNLKPYRLRYQRKFYIMHVSQRQSSQFGAAAWEQKFSDWDFELLGTEKARTKFGCASAMRSILLCGERWPRVSHCEWVNTVSLQHESVRRRLAWQWPCLCPCVGQRSRRDGPGAAAGWAGPATASNAATAAPPSTRGERTDVSGPQPAAAALHDGATHPAINQPFFATIQIAWIARRMQNQNTAHLLFDWCLSTVGTVYHQ